MSYTDYLKELLRPLGVYDVEAPFNGGELTAAGEALDGAFGALEEVERESSLVTARSWGLEGVAKLLLHRPAAETEEGLSQALAALLRIGDDSFTPEAINDTITGCGVAAECVETGVGRVQVRFPGVVGVPAQIDRLKQIIEEIVPPQVEIGWFYRFLTWAELEEQFPTWAALEEAELSWSQLEMHVLP